MILGPLLVVYAILLSFCVYQSITNPCDSVISVPRQDRLKSMLTLKLKQWQVVIHINLCYWIFIIALRNHSRKAYANILETNTVFFRIGAPLRIEAPSVFFGLVNTVYIVQGILFKINVFC